MHAPFFWLIAGLAVAVLVFAVRLAVKAARRAKLERTAEAAEAETIERPPDLG
jgi:uncharacterized membrane protein